MRKRLSEDIRRAAEAEGRVEKQDLARWQARAKSMEKRLDAARGIIGGFEPDDTYGALIRMSVIDALDE